MIAFVSSAATINTAENRQIDLVTRYTGHRYDPVVGMYYARFRMYDATIRRFTAIDPVLGTVLNPHTMVQYTYVLNNPVRYIDPWGLWTGPCGRPWCNDLNGWDDTFDPLAGSTSPSPPTRDQILEEVWEWVNSMTEGELMFAIGSGMFEAMGVHIPSDWVEAIASGEHRDFNEIQQDLVGWIVDTIIEDSSGLGTSLLEGWYYFPGNGWNDFPGGYSLAAAALLPQAKPLVQTLIEIVAVGIGIGSLTATAPPVVSSSPGSPPTTVIGGQFGPSSVGVGTQGGVSTRVPDGIIIVYSQNLTPQERASIEKSIRNLNKRKQEHEDKLHLYRRNPDAHDNQGHLKNAPTQQIREQIIRTRIGGLEREIQEFQRLIDINQQLLQ